MARDSGRGVEVDQPSVERADPQAISLGEQGRYLGRALVAEIDLHLPAAGSLKEKRSVVTSIVRNLDQIHGVAAAEVDHLDVWQRTLIGSAVVGGTASRVRSVMDGIERYVWSRPEVEVLEFRTSWWEDD